MAHAGLGRRVRPHDIRTHSQPPGPAARPERHISMNDTGTLIRIETEQTPDLPTAPGAIVMHDLNFRYGKVQALRDVTMTVPANAVTAIIGPSGCGKSTLLRTINRIYELY